MIWLLKLYPRQWRRRYGAEVADLVAASPFSIGGALDLIGGAVDAWLHPELIPPASESDGGTSMMKQLMRFDCARARASRGERICGRCDRMAPRSFVSLASLTAMAIAPRSSMA